MTKSEKQHKPLRRIFNILREIYPGLDAETCLYYAIKDLNYTLRYNGLGSILLSSTLPVLRITNDKLTYQEPPFRALK